jgi:hypothetical protein
MAIYRDARANAEIQAPSASLHFIGSFFVREPVGAAVNGSLVTLLLVSRVGKSPVLQFASRSSCR